ncbi:MAG: hypothetical protein LBJ12_01580 [Oscillospiraceae bacterium]|jgi:hypothetical protein|nr:hypothetical protein [Oscillospiraceae bacterium]
MREFKDVVIVILAHDEVKSLRETVEGLVSLCSVDDLEQIIIFLAPNATPECSAMAQTLSEDLQGVRVRVVKQIKRIGLREMQDVLAAQSNASHAMFISSDLEIPLPTFAQMITESKHNPDALISLSRWKKGGGFNDYPKWQLLLHYIFQKIVRVLYQNRKLTDATAGYTMMPNDILVNLNLRETNLSIMLEYKLCSLRLGLPLVELPAQYQTRKEGQSANSFLQKFNYFLPLFRVRFTPKNQLLREKGAEHA